MKKKVIIPPHVLEQLEREFGSETQAVLDDIKKMFENGPPAGAQLIDMEKLKVEDPKLYQKIIDDVDDYDEPELQ